MLELDPSSRITPELALEHEYFADFSKYKTLVSLGELQTSLDPESDSEVLDEEIQKTGDLAELMQAYRGKQKATSNFHSNNSLFFNPTPIFQNSCYSPGENSSGLEKKVTKHSDLQQEQDEGEQRNTVKEFIVRMTPMMQKRKKLDNSYYKDAIMRAAGVKENAVEEKFSSEKADSSSKKKILLSPFSSSKKSSSNNPAPVSPASEIEDSINLNENSA